MRTSTTQCSCFKFVFLLLPMMLSLLVGCTRSDDDPITKSDEIDTLNIYTQRPVIETEDGSIFAYNPKSGQNNLLSRFSNKPGSTFTMDTNPDKQGFDYLVYVKEDIVYLLNYVTGRSKALAELDGEMCAIYPHRKVSEKSFEDSNNYRKIISDESLFYVLTHPTSCSEASGFSYFQVDYELAAKNNTVAILPVTSDRLSPLLVADFDFRGGTLLAPIEGRWGYLGYDINSSQLNMLDENQQPLWSVYLPYSTTPPAFTQITDDEILLQRDRDLFIIPVDELFSVLEESNTSPPTIPSSSRAQALFSDDQIDHTLSTDTLAIYDTASNTRQFVINDNNALYYFDGNMLSALNNTFDPTLESLQFGVTVDEVIFVANYYEDAAILSQIEPGAGIEQTILTADYLTFFIADNEIYVSSQITDESPSNISYRFNRRLESTPYDNSMFVKLYRQDKDETTPLLLSSDTISTDGYLTNPELYAYDPVETDGRKVSLVNGVAEPFSFGQLDGNTSNYFLSSQINDIYGLLEFELIDTDSLESRSDLYFFNPSERDSLQLISSYVLD